MNLAKHIIEKHGGSIAAASEGEGRGTEFTIRLPLGPAPNPKPAEPAASAAKPDGVAVQSLDAVVEKGAAVRVLSLIHI